MRADRLLQVMFLLRRHGRMTVGDLASRLEVSERTVQRDLEALSTAGVPVWSERGRGGGWELMGDYRTDLTGLTATEAQAVFAWTSRTSTTDLGLGSELARALTKLASSVPASAIEEADALASVLVVDPRRWFTDGEQVPLLPTLRDAAVRRRRVRMRYRSASAPAARQRTVDPYGLVENAGRWYLLAAHRGEVRSYRVSRMETVEVLDVPARVPSDADLAGEWARVRARLESSGEPVALEVAVRPSVVDDFRRVVPFLLAPGVRVEAVPGRLDDGWPVFALTVRARRAASAVVLGLGGDVRLLSPDWLRVETLDRAAAALAVHGAGGMR